MENKIVPEFNSSVNNNSLIPPPYPYYQQQYQSNNNDQLFYSPSAPNPPPIVLQPMTNYIGREPTQILCSNCNSIVMTRVNYESGTGTFLFCCLICVFGCDLGCQFIPFCVDGCKDAKHYCPNCNNYLGQKTLL
ncbi:unnamed protein product [Brachionus calyciflorus]|uniref:LITAF domain-containing protein n=1 Tax=Brachionus calyciflorus TaxID=104777 RepID=A0A814BUI0_9BILA|nr:unnamed protein product [Brachionus calyciflorus]